MNRDSARTTLATTLGQLEVTVAGQGHVHLSGSLLVNRTSLVVTIHVQQVEGQPVWRRHSLTVPGSTPRQRQRIMAVVMPALDALVAQQPRLMLIGEREAIIKELRIHQEKLVSLRGEIHTSEAAVSRLLPILEQIDAALAQN